MSAPALRARLSPDRLYWADRASGLAPLCQRCQAKAERSAR